MKTLKLLSLTFLFLFASSCGSLSPINPLSLLTNNTWELSSLNGNKVDPNQYTGSVPRLDFLDGGKLSGYSGCNNFSGNFLLEGSTLKLDPGAITKKACSGSGEQAFLSVMNSVNQLKVNKNKLTLFDGTVELMSFFPRKD
jgi:heat shock protein HslJ